MAQLNNLIVTGNSRFLNPINGDARNGVYYVKGTQTAATGAWTGVIPVPALYDGLTIMYYLPYAPSGNATLNLTLSNGTTTGAVNCYYGNATRLTTHYSQGSNIVMTYHPAGSISINGTATTDNRWIANANYADGNTTYVLTDYYSRFVAGANKVFPYTMIMQCADGRWESIVTSSSIETSKTRNTHGFRLGQLALLYANATYEENAVLGDNQVHLAKTDTIDHRYSFNTANNSTSGTTANKPIYLVGALNSTDGLFYLDTTWWTQTLPTTADGKLYIYLGDAYDYYRMSFNIYHPVYCYTNGKIRQFAQDSATVNGHTVAVDVPSNAEFTDTQSDWNATSGKAAILNKPTIPTVNNGTLTIQKNGTQVATFTANQSGNSTANITVPTVTDTYSSTGTDATSGKAVAAALGTRDGTVSGTAGASKTLTAFSQTDGKVSATFGNISITKSQVSDFPAIDTTVTSGSSNLVTSGAVAAAIDNLPEPMVFKGTLGTGGTITTLPTASASNEGYTYKVITAGTYASQAAKVGDVFVSNATEWVLIPAGDEITSDTWRAIKVNGTQLLGSAISTGDVNFKNGSNVTITGSGNDITIASTDEKVTSSANHYTPDTASGGDKSASASGATAAWSIDVVKGVTLNTDGKGHVTGISVTSGKIPANPNTDVNVRQTLTSGDANRPILLSHAGSTTTTTNVDNLAYRNNSIYANPSTGTITATKFVGDISGGTGLTSTQVTNALGYTPPTQDTNTTYTFANGTNGFTVTPSGGTAQTVTVTPSIANNITGSGTTGSFAKFTGANTIGDATAAVDSATTGISIADHSTTSITGVQSTTTTASKVTLGTAISVPNVTSVGSASTWAFENITVPKAASSATSIPNVTAAGSGSFTATVTDGVLSFNHVHTAPTLGTAISITGVSGSTTASHVTSGGNGTAPTLGTAISVPNVTAATNVTVPIKNTSSTTVVTGKTHSITDNGHTHTLS